MQAMSGDVTYKLFDIVDNGYMWLENVAEEIVTKRSLSHAAMCRLRCAFRRVLNYTKDRIKSIQAAHQSLYAWISNTTHVVPISLQLTVPYISPPLI